MGATQQHALNFALMKARLENMAYQPPSQDKERRSMDRAEVLWWVGLLLGLVALLGLHSIFRI